MIEHPPQLIRDTSKYLPFRKLNNGAIPSLSRLASELLKIDIQTNHHSPIEDARTTMLLYRRYRSEWKGNKQKRKSLKINR
jgi:RNA exonuclease 4